MKEGEIWDIFCTGIKQKVRMEFMKSIVDKFDDAAKIAPRVDSAIWGASSSRTRGDERRQGGSAMPSPSPMEIGNVERVRTGGQKFEGQSLMDYRNKE